MQILIAYGTTHGHTRQLSDIASVEQLAFAERAARAVVADAAV